MNKEFLDFYDRELRLLYEQSKDFAALNPGIAERLGGFQRDNMDPGLQGVLEGTAFLAARVQQKIKSEFSEFTTALLDQLLPNYLQPTPSFVMVQAHPKYEDTALLEGKRFGVGSRLDAVYVERERRVACQFRLGADLVVWPLRLEKAEYYAGPAPLQALGLEVAGGTLAGLRLNFYNRLAGPELDSPGVTPPGNPLKQLLLDELPIHLVASRSDADSLLEQLFANLKRITLRYENSFGDPAFLPLTLDQIQQVGFDETDRLYPVDNRVFSGFDTLREYFAFPNKFIGFKMRGLRELLRTLDAKGFDLLFEFDTSRPQLASVINASQFALYAAPAANLFDMQCSRVPLNTGEHEHQVVPDRSRWLEYETHRILEVHAHYAGRREKVDVFPLYSMPTSNIRMDHALFYTARRLPRLLTAQEQRYGTQSNYTGTETFLSLFDPADLDAPDRAKELSVRAICSNRHLAEQLPVGATGADFLLVDDTAMLVRCIAGPTKPRDSIIHAERTTREAHHPGPMMWRLINLLSLSHLGLTDRSDEDKAGGLRELLALFADVTDTLTEAQVRGIVSVDSRPVVRRLRQANGFNAARGVEVTVTLDEKSFEGSGIMVIGSALDRFFAEYTSVNSFTQTVIASAQRGTIMRWPPRSGLGGTL